MTGRNAYHHGDLRNALIAAAAELAERGGPQAVTIRAAARAVSVTPTAAYRHFSGHEELLLAARSYSLEQMGDAMRARLAALPAEPDPAKDAMARIDAIGRGYVDFALSHPGLFRTAFVVDPARPPLDFQTPEGPHVMLVRAVDELARQGFVDDEFRVGAEVAAWSLVHGLSLLMLEGPLSRLPEQERETVVDQTMGLFARSYWAVRAARGLT
ncbi:MAG TPA: TetR/AcrR family transcriptional regulator [Kribbella sp.]|uniref:TetR/AcrR family transcriptional regulator n=1 Tax=Kribbella sp. TaxID=1871183 RepID=UPI002D77D06F|nr:TetR/AcrR family transcriptional regulator [Kribbella sp.]HET6296149.1 TetR/AcrR family transcriptional regulator [Kribbella sp.]